MDDTNPQAGINVSFVGLPKGEAPPPAALYELDPNGRPVAKLASITDGVLPVEAERLKGMTVAIGPEHDNLADIDPATLLRYRAYDAASLWQQQGILIPEGRWWQLWRERVCVTGHMRKCRPWWFDRIEATATVSNRAIVPQLKVRPATTFATLGSLLQPNIRVPVRCLPVCDGVVEIYERVCCCDRIIIWELIDRLREVLVEVPLPTGPTPPEPGPFRGFGAKSRITVAKGAVAGTAAMAVNTPPERLFDDYQALTAMPQAEAEAYVHARPYLFPFICHCTSRKVGETFLQPGGTFDFCYWRARTPIFQPVWRRCWTTYAYRLRQKIAGTWTVVYDGVAAHDYFADILPRARTPTSASAIRAPRSAATARARPTRATARRSSCSNMSAARERTTSTSRRRSRPASSARCRPLPACTALAMRPTAPGRACSASAYGCRSSFPASRSTTASRSSGSTIPAVRSAPRSR